MQNAMGKKNPIYKNCEVRIESLTDTHVTFEGHSPMPRSVLSSFDYTYAYTGHKIQGRSFEGKVLIYDAFFKYASRNWLWVALTPTGNYVVNFDDGSEGEYSPADILRFKWTPNAAQRARLKKDPTWTPI
jgi:hypothetical protein